MSDRLAWLLPGECPAMPIRPLSLGLAVVYAVSWGQGIARATETFHEPYDQGKPSLTLPAAVNTFRITTQERQADQRKTGAGAERLAGTSLAGGTIQFVQTVPPAVAIADLTATLWVRANRPGLQLHLRVVFPESRNETGRPYKVLIAGEVCEVSGRWRKLSCQATSEVLEEAVRRIRYRYPDQSFSTRYLYIDAVVLTVPFGPQRVDFELFVDDLHYGPIVKPKKIVAPPEAALRELPPVDPPVEFRLNHLTVEGQPFFPVIMPYFAGVEEDLELFQSTAVNVAWIPDYRNVRLIERLRQAGIWVTAGPPHDMDDHGELADATKPGLIPFGRETRGILFWNLTSRIPVSSLDQTIAWVRQIHAADTLFERPTLADVTEGADAFSNHIDMLAVSRHISNTSIGYRLYRDWLRARRTEAFVNTFFWTWIQIEPSRRVNRTRQHVGNRPIIIEPTQIRLQVYAALQAGCRGIGYWRTVPFGTQSPGIKERRLTLARLNLELEILEPLLASAGAPGAPFSFPIAGQRTGSAGPRVRPGYHAIGLTGRQPNLDPLAETDHPVGTADAVMMPTDFGPVMIAAWFGEGAQFCPGRLARNNVEIIVPGIEETAPAWLITPTKITLLRDERVAGGKQITLDKFDQTAVVLFTSDTRIINRLRREIARLAPRAAMVSVELAATKRRRVAATHRQLTALAPPLPDGNAILGRADQFLAEANSALSQGQYDAARIAADNCLQSLRILQHAHWIDAVRPLPSPLTSPHTVSFSTLPDHYELIARVGRQLRTGSRKNLLPASGFESSEQVLAAKWKHEAEAPKGVAAGADLVATAPHTGRYALELYARRPPGTQPRIDARPAYVTFQSPAIPVKAGTVLCITGWVRVLDPVAHQRDGATIHDNLLGLAAGLRWTKTKGWEQFEMLREVPADGQYQLTLALHGLGRVQFDDLRIVAYGGGTTIAAEPENLGGQRSKMK